MSEIISNAVIESILSRRSIRSYTDAQISDRELETILQAGIWAPTARNAQEINFYVIQNKDSIRELAERYSKYAFNDGKVRNFAYGAPTLILLYGKSGARFMEIDAGIAAENMTLAAHSLGLGSLIIGCIKEYLYSDDGREYATSIGISEDLSFGIALAIGHTNEPTPSKPRLEDRIKYIK